MKSSGGGYTCFEQIEHDTSACFGCPSFLLTEYWIIASFAFVVRLALPPTSNAMRETRAPERRQKTVTESKIESLYFLLESNT